MQINVQKLRGMGFKVENIAPYGDCIIVPGKKFDPDWEDMLEGQGNPVVFTEICSQKVVLVRLMGQKVSQEVEGVKMARLEEVGVTSSTPSTPSTSTVSTPQPPKRIPGFLKKNPERMWQDPDVERLTELWNHKPRLTVADIAKRFNNRTGSAVTAKLKDLQDEGVIKHRNRKHPKPPKKPTRAEKAPGMPLGPTGPRLPCVFGWGDCPVRKLLAEETREADTMLKSVSPVPGIPRSTSEAEFMKIMMSSMQAAIQQFASIQTTERVAQFCQACPKPRAKTLD